MPDVRVRVLPHPRFRDGLSLNTAGGAAQPGDTVMMPDRDARDAVRKGWVEALPAESGDWDRSRQRVRVLPHSRFQGGVGLSTDSGAAGPGEVTTMSWADARFATAQGWVELVPDDEEGEAVPDPAPRRTRGR